MSTLYIVATPLGNLGDISARALEILKKVDLILAEDTRVSKKLLAHFGIGTPILSYHQHSKLSKVDYIIQLLEEGKNLALISDAGTPGISDPGGMLVEAVVKEFGDSIKIEPIPGPSAVTAIASICGFSMDKFLFLGFPPQKNKRRKFFEEVLSSKYPVIFYESPHRILKTLTELKNFLQTTNCLLQTKVVVGRELTKKFETIYRGTVIEVIARAEKTPLKGEFVVVVSSK